MDRRLKGLGVSAGNAEGEVVSDTAEMPKGSVILVVRDAFDPVLLARAQENIVGVVAERGGLTSHASNIARERALPCVVRVDCSQIADGVTVRVDGDLGVVDIL